MAPREKQEYEERPADEDGTPMQRLERLMKRVIAVPKTKLDERERQSRRKANS